MSRHSRVSNADGPLFPTIKLYDAFQFGKKVGSGNWATVYGELMDGLIVPFAKADC